MSLNEIERISREVRLSVLDEADQHASYSRMIETNVDNQLQNWRTESAKLLTEDNPFISEYEKLEKWNRLQADTGALTVKKFEAATRNLLRFCSRVKRPGDESFWRKQLDYHKTQPEAQESSESLATNAKFLANMWQKVIDESSTEWELEQLSARRAKLIKQLKDFLSIFNEISHSVENLGIEPGALLDLSSGELTFRDIQKFKAWAKYLSEDEGVRRLCEVLGKMRQLEFSERIDRISVNHTLDIPHPDFNSREEIVGIKLGRDLEHALPSELALLSDPETELLFDLKFIESGIMCFEMQGTEFASESLEIEKDVQISEEEKQGPMVICLDTSGSMAGAPESIAKAVSLYIASKAKEQNRPCYLINFSTGIETLEIGQFANMSSLIDFLSMSFHGGTDATPAISHALEIMNQEAYEKADVLVISDFIMGELKQSLFDKIELLRESGNRFHSLVIGNVFMTKPLQTLFDQEWIFDPATSRIHELIRFNEGLNHETRT